MRYALVIPTYNGGSEFKRLLKSLEIQDLPLSRKCIIDSQSQDNTLSLAREAGFDCYSTTPEAFDHGNTRQEALAYIHPCEVVIFLTQDVTLANSESLKHLVKAFENPRVALAFGCQLPYPHHDWLSKHARHCNYPKKSYLRSYDDKEQYGIKTIFFSNAFSAYRVADLQKIGGFPSSIILGEDVCVAAKALQKGYLLAYVAEAKVQHSHNFSWVQEFRSYFDYGVFHQMEAKLLAPFASVHSSAWKYAFSEWKYLLYRRPYLLLWSFLRLLVKYSAYQAGKHHLYVPKSWKRRLSRHPNFWRGRKDSITHSQHTS